MNKALMFVLLIQVSASWAESWFPGGGDTTTPPESAPPLCSAGLDGETRTCLAWGLEWGLIQGSYAFSAETSSAVYAFNSMIDVRNCLAGTLAADHKMKTVCDTGGPWRLPNIKELSNMFRYTANTSQTGNSALTNTGNRTWFHVDGSSNKNFISYGVDEYDKGDNDTAASAEHLTTGATPDSLDLKDSAQESVTPYIISATYRDTNYNSDPTNNGDQDVQLLAVNLKTGEIVSLTQYFKFCRTVSKTGVCTGISTKRDPAINPIFVFRVKTIQ